MHTIIPAKDKDLQSREEEEREKVKTILDEYGLSDMWHLVEDTYHDMKNDGEDNDWESAAYSVLDIKSEAIREAMNSL